MALGLVCALVSTACGGSDGAGTDEVTIQGDIVVTDPEDVQEAIDARGPDAEPTPEVASASGADTDSTSGGEADAAPADAGDQDEVEVAEVEEDELDGLLNSLTVFNTCLTGRGFDLDGFPGDGSGRTLEDFDQDYLAALGACAAESGIQEAADSFGESQANLTPEEIEQTNFGLPVFKTCMEDLGWTVGELVPDERGALGLGLDGVGLTPPGGGGIGEFNTDDISTCRREAEQYVADNFVAEGDAS